MTDRTSSANPARLAQYATDGAALVTTVATEVAALRAASDEMAAAGWPVPGLATLVTDLEDVLLDWAHLDGFAGAVGDGFAAHLVAHGLPGATNHVVMVSDADLARYGAVGFADRDEAIRRAESLAAEVRGLLDRHEDREVSPDDVAGLVALAEQGMHDPSFAVTLSEELGVEGYVDLVGMIREVHHDEWGNDGVDDSLASVGVLATVLTTALATHGAAGRPDDGRVLPPRSDDMVIDRGFVDDLAGDYDPGNLLDGHEHTDLSVLVGMTAPPTEVAVRIADNRMSEALYAATLTDLTETVDLAWGEEHSGIITNYARMLGRDPDASAAWLGTNPPGPGGTNLELVLRQDGGTYVDDGEALATIVRNGVTHDDLYVRHELMDASVTILGEDGDLLANAHMPDALARGVAANMTHFDHRINSGWDPMRLGTEVPARAAEAHEFFREIMIDDAAANRVYAALAHYAFEEFQDLPEPGVDHTPSDGMDNRIERLETLGFMQGTVAAAEGNALQDVAEDVIGDQRTRGSLANFVIGFTVPGSSPALNDLAEVGNASIGALAFPADLGELEAAEQMISDRSVAFDLDNAILLSIAQEPSLMPSTPLHEMSEEDKQRFLETIAGSDAYNRGEHNFVRAGYSRASDAFLPG